MTCPSCEAALSERRSYCKACGAQARCLGCRALLEPGAFACVECGVRCGEGKLQVIGEGLHTPSSLAASRNTLSFYEDRSSRRFDASLTDHAMASLGDVFGELLVQRGPVRVPQMVRTPLRNPQLLDAQTELPLLPSVQDHAPVSAGTNDHTQSDKIQQ